MDREAGTMTISEEPTRFSKYGEWLGGRCRSYLRAEKLVAAGLLNRGIPKAIATLLRWSVRIVIALLAIFLALSIALILVLALVVAKSMERSTFMKEDWAIGEQYHERDDPFYDPINNSQSVDPRFDDD
ncbi:uncharacterized protein DUF3742 [Pseudomonas sp. LAIL14HWK12:I2]|nr:uncharacterized protein DUF3742 [Pseudomonas sp. LAIL14HWK12:I2]